MPNNIVITNHNPTVQERGKGVGIKWKTILSYFSISFTYSLRLVFFLPFPFPLIFFLDVGGILGG